MSSVAGLLRRQHRPVSPAGWPGPVDVTGRLARLARRASPGTRVRIFSLALALAAALGYVVGVRDLVGPAAPIVLPWPLLGLGFFAAEIKVVNVQFRRETHSFSLSEVPGVIGLFFVGPSEYLLALLLGSAAALIYPVRQTAIKMGFNLAMYALCGVVSLLVFHSFARFDGTPGLLEWLATFLAMLVVTAVSGVAIATAITLSGGAPQYQKLPEMLRFGALVTVANTSLGLLTVAVLWIDPSAAWLMAVPLVIVFLAYRAYVSEREKHGRLQLLYESSRILQHSPELDSALLALLVHAREMFHAERAEVILHAPDKPSEAFRTTAHLDGPPEVMVPAELASDDPIRQRVERERHPFIFTARASPPESGRSARRPVTHQTMVSPLIGESGLIGVFMIANRLGEGTGFQDDDLRLLETLSNQAAVALENGQLEQSLSELSRLKDELKHMAFHDDLTNLANRTFFVQEVEARLATGGAQSLPVVLFLDLDDFKVVNDTLGHAMGDRLLVAVAERISGCLRATDLAARLGGDEFAIVLSDGPDLASATAIAARIGDALKAPFIVDGQELVIGASIGVAAAHGAGERVHDLLRSADEAMYTAKTGGKHRAAVFEQTMHEAIVARHELTAELAHATAHSEFEVFYQPVVMLASGHVVGTEALVRWNHPTRGIVGPDEFIGLAEESGLVLSLGSWVLREACRQTVRWQRVLPGCESLWTSVNVSPHQIQQVEFVDEVLTVLEETDCKPSDLVLEITEAAMFRDPQTTIARLQRLRAHGIRIALDDFGTGYSSLSYLRRFPVSILKVAPEFIGPADGDTETWAFAHAIIALARTLGLTAIAEGIEVPGQRDRLSRMGCELGQGHWFARAANPQAIARVLSSPDGSRSSIAPAGSATARSMASAIR